MKKLFSCRLLPVLCVIFIFQITTLSLWANAADSPQAQVKQPINNVSRHDPEEKLKEQDKYDVTHYGIELKFDIANRTIAGKCTIKGKSKTNGLKTILLDLYDNLNVTAVSGHGAGFKHESNILTIELNKNLRKNEAFTVTVEYNGNPTRVGGDGVTFTSHGSGGPLVFTQNEPYFARIWLPCKDVPYDKCNTADISVTVPDSLTAASNGILKEVVNNRDGTKTFKWHEKHPMATYLIAIAISDYVEFSHRYKYSNKESMEVRYYVFPEYMERSNPGIDLCVEMIEAFSKVYGQYPFLDEKYAMSQYSWGGAMENQTNSFMTNFNERTTAHELAHQWWGDMVTCSDWRNIWINEGFATYSEAIWYENKYGKERYDQHMQSLMSRTFSGSIYRHDISYAGSVITGIVYSKAASVLHMLRNLVGDKTFFNIIKDYRKQYFYGNAGTLDFHEVCEKYYGEDLDWFFTQWIYGEGRPRYEYGWVYMNGDRHILQLRLKQNQMSKTLFEMPLTIRAEYEGGYRDFVINNKSRDELHQFKIENKPTNIIIDPENKVLKTTRQVDFDTSAVIEDKIALFQNSPNPFYYRTRIEVFIPECGNMSLKIYNIKGEEIKELSKGYAYAGKHEYIWGGEKNNGEKVGSGVYIYKLKTEDYTEIKKLLFFKSGDS